MYSTIPAVTAHNPIPTAQQVRYASRSTSGHVRTESRLRLIRTVPGGGVNPGLAVNACVALAIAYGLIP
jgi:hypothetical protein